MTLLNCSIVGDGSMVSIIIEEWKTVALLKDAIKEKNTTTIKCDAKDLQLFLAKTEGGAWMPPNGLGVVALQRGAMTGHVEMLLRKTIDPAEVIGDLFGDTATKEMIHVLVLVPESPASGATETTTPQAKMIVTVPAGKRRRTDAAGFSRLEELVAITTVGQQLTRETDLTVGNVLDMPKTVFSTSLCNGLYIRQEYWDLHKMIEQGLALNGSLGRVLVLGSPGIGKSVFGVFLLLVFMTERKDIACRPLGESSTYYFNWNSANGYDISDTPLAGRAYEDLFDGNEAGGALGFGHFLHAYVFASPRTKHYNKFVKEVCFKVYMNPWTKAECKSFVDAIHLEDPDEWVRRFNLVGGKPRFVFSSSEKFDDLAKRVDSAIPHNIDELKDQVGLFEQKEFDERMNHIVFHIYRDESAPSCSYLRYSSSAVEAIVSARYNIHTVYGIRSLLKTPSHNL